MAHDKYGNVARDCRVPVSVAARFPDKHTVEDEVSKSEFDPTYKFIHHAMKIFGLPSYVLSSTSGASGPVVPIAPVDWDWEWDGWAEVDGPSAALRITLLLPATRNINFRVKRGIS